MSISGWESMSIDRWEFDVDRSMDASRSMGLDRSIDRVDVDVDVGTSERRTDGQKTTKRQNDKPTNGAIGVPLTRPSRGAMRDSRRVVTRHPIVRCFYRRGPIVPTRSSVVFERGDYESERPRARARARGRGLVPAVDPARVARLKARSTDDRIMGFATIGAPMTFTVRAARHAEKGHQGAPRHAPEEDESEPETSNADRVPDGGSASVPAVMTVVSK